MHSSQQRGRETDAMHCAFWKSIKSHWIALEWLVAEGSSILPGFPAMVLPGRVVVGPISTQDLLGVASFLGLIPSKINFRICNLQRQLFTPWADPAM